MFGQILIWTNFLINLDESGIISQVNRNRITVQTLWELGYNALQINELNINNLPRPTIYDIVNKLENRKEFHMRYLNGRPHILNNERDHIHEREISMLHVPN